MAVILNFFTQVPYWELLLILFAKIVEVSIGTLRVILIAKGFRKPGTILAIFEILLWVFVASTVINGISEAPIKGIVYSIGFAVGVYIGSILENKLAVGKTMIHIITSVDNKNSITNIIRENGFGVTEISAKGMHNDKVVLLVFTNRKNSLFIMNKVELVDPKAVVVANEVSVIKGGFVNPLRQVIK